MAHVVIAGALVARLPEKDGGGERYFYRGDELLGIDDEEIARLTEIGLVEDDAKSSKAVEDDDAKSKAKPK